MDDFKDLSREDLIRVADHLQRQASVVIEANQLMAEKLGIDFTDTELRVTGMDSTPDGGFNIGLQESAHLQHFAETLVRNFKDSGATNYFTIGVQDPTGKERYEVTMQKVSGETPMNQAARLRQEVADLKKRLGDE